MPKVYSIYKVFTASVLVLKKMTISYPLVICRLFHIIDFKVYAAFKPTSEHRDTTLESSNQLFVS